jgi:hypothetical protein
VAQLARLTGGSLWIVAMLLFVSILSGCGSIGPKTVDRDRFDYITAISESWKRQTLLNIVKLRYADVPVFMEVGQVISGYELESTFSASGTLGDKSWRSAGGALGTFFNLGASGRYLDRPTVTYAPLTGPEFVKTMMTPFPPGSIMFLLEAGWPVDVIMQVGVQAINGLRNHRGGPYGHPADPEFTEAIRLLQRIQLSGGLGFKLAREKEAQEATVLLFHTRRLTPETARDVAEVKRLLRLNPEASEIRITYGADVLNDNEIALHTRSGYQVLIELAWLVSVPPEHVADRRTIGTTAPSPEETPALRPIMSIHSGTEQTDKSYTQVRYRDHWYWIDDRDMASKRVFTFLTVLFTLSETGQKIQQPILTIRAN